MRWCCPTAQPVRPAAHAGGAYAAEPETLREQLAERFTCPGGPGPLDPTAMPNGRKLCAVVSPHIDPYRGGPTFAWAYKRIAEESTADLFVIFGTAHGPMRQMFGVTRKSFDTPLGIVPTHGPFIQHLVDRLAADPAGRSIDLFADELAHRHEHSIEFQAMFLQYVLGPRRPFHIVPVLVGSFHEFIGDGREPEASPQVSAVIRALRAVAEEYAGRVCFISGADLAHIGQRFGDQDLLDQRRLAEQSADDRQLLAAATGPGSSSMLLSAATGAESAASRRPISCSAWRPPSAASCSATTRPPTPTGLLVSALPA